MDTPRDKIYPDTTAQALTDPQDAAAYLDAVLALEDPDALLVALRNVADARDATEVSNKGNAALMNLIEVLRTAAVCVQSRRAGHA